MFVKEFLLEQEDSYHTDGNRSICQVEHRAEELKLLSPHKGEPGRVMRLHQREIQHVHYSPMQEGGIAVMREYFGDMIERTFLEYQSIEHTVYEVAQCTGKNETGTDDKTAMIFFLNDRLDIIDTEYHGYETKEREGHLTPRAAELPAPGHAFILHEIDLRLVA